MYVALTYMFIFVAYNTQSYVHDIDRKRHKYIHITTVIQLPLCTLSVHSYVYEVSYSHVQSFFATYVHNANQCRYVL